MFQEMLTVLDVIGKKHDVSISNVAVRTTTHSIITLSLPTSIPSYQNILSTHSTVNTSTHSQLRWVLDQPAVCAIHIFSYSITIPSYQPTL